jgi:glycosyltransferase involved in cell wall biosynthesis
MKAAALLGRRDEPVDGVADYCSFLAQAIQKYGVDLEIVHVPWAERGWKEALDILSRESRDWSGRWVLLQYTAMAWSRRGFPFRVLAVQNALRKRGARCGIVFHDVVLDPLAGLHNRVRRAIQYWVMQQLLARSEFGVFSTPPEPLGWTASYPDKVKFHSVGANIPECSTTRQFPTGGAKTAAIFCISGGIYRSREVRDILLVAELVKLRVPDLQLEIFGRGVEEAKPGLEGPLRSMGVNFRLRSVLPADEVARTLRNADVFLCVRGEIATNRGSAIAAIASGLPIVAFGKRGRVQELDAAGIEFAPSDSVKSYADATVRVLTDGALWQELHERNRRALAEYFSWDSAARFFAGLMKSSETPAQ